MKKPKKENQRTDQEIVEDLIQSLPDAEMLVISTLSSLRHIPAAVGRLKSLNSLIISACPKLEELPNELAEIKTLRSLSINYSMHKMLLPGISAFTQLRKLSLKGQDFSKKTNWNLLTSLKGIESLELSYSLINMKGELPAEIFALQKLQFLYLDNNRLKKIPYEIGQLKSLLLLDLGYNLFTDFPDALLLLPNLETLIINAEPINNIPFELFEMPALKELKITGRNAQKFPFVGHVEKFFKTVKKKKFSSDYINLVLDVLKFPELFEELETAELLSLLNCEIEPIVFRSLEKLETLLSDHFRVPDTDAVVFIAGKTFENKSIIKSRLLERGIDCVSKISKNVTHVLLGPEMKTTDFRAYPQLIFMTENMLKQISVTKDFEYLSDKSADYEDNISKIAALLISEDEDNNYIGLGLLNNAPLPLALVTDLVFLYKKTSNTQIRKQCSALLKKSGQLELAMNLKRRMPLTAIAAEHTLSKNLLYYSSFDHVDALRLLNLVFQSQGKGIKFGLMHLNSSDKLKFFEVLIAEGHLDLSAVGLERLPDDFGIFSEQIRSLDLSFNHFTEFPIHALLKLKQLSELNFNNYNIWYYPDEISNLEQLSLLSVPENFIQLASETLQSKLKEKKVKVKLIKPSAAF